MALLANFSTLAKEKKKKWHSWPNFSTLAKVEKKHNGTPGHL
jgi:hypothetical protein